MASRGRKLLRGIALVAFFAGIGGALTRGFSGVSQDCRTWVNSNGYQLLQNDWWAKSRGCVARTPGGDEVAHSEDLRSKATGWAWQFAIFAVGALPAVGMIVFVSTHPQEGTLPAASRFGTNDAWPGYTSGTVTTRRPQAQQRRRELCDAAIELLAQDGARGLTHLRVDRRAGVADGSTSFYFHTRADLLRAVTDRVVSQDVADFEAAMAAAKAADDDQEATLLSRLAEQAMRTAVEPERSRARARFELMMMSQRDPALAAVFKNLMDRFVAIGEEAVAQLQPRNSPLDKTLIKAQAFAVITFLGGFLFRLANGIAGLRSARELEGYLHAVIAGVAAEHGRTG